MMSDEYTMTEIEVADLRQCDVGTRVVVLHDGGTFDGMLISAWTSWDKYAKPVPAPKCRIEVTNGDAAVAISRLPMDFLLQIQRNSQTDEAPHE